MKDIDPEIKYLGMVILVILYCLVVFAFWGWFIYNVYSLIKNYV